MYALRKLTLTEARLFLREPVGVFFAVGFPAILVAILGSIKSFRNPDPALGGMRVVDLYVTIAMVMILAFLALQMGPQALATYREKGILRRVSATPVHPAKVLVAQLVMNLLTALLAAAIVLGLGRLAFNVPLPRQFFGFVLAFLLAAGATLAVGLFIAAVAPSGKAAGAIGTIAFFPLMFFAGLWAPREVMPGWVRRVGDFTPLAAGEQALHDALAGSWPHAGQLLVLAAYIVVFGGAAVRFFRWE